MVAATVSTDRRLVISLLMLTAVTGLVDAASVLALGRVFTGNMTGNVLLLGFSIGGAHDVSITGSIIALGAFLVGAVSGGRILRSFAQSAVRTVLVSEFVLLLAAAGFAALSDERTETVRATLLVFLAVAMGLQSAAARGLAVPNLTTVVLTSMLTAAALNSSLAGGTNLYLPRTVAALLAMLLGAVAGAVLLGYGLAWTIGGAVLVQALAVATFVSARAVSASGINS